MGMSTLVDFLQKRGHVVENNPNSKITEEEFEILVKEFSQDMSLKQEAERMVHERTNRDKPKVEVPVAAPVEEVKLERPRIEDEVIDLRPQIKHVGTIDLDALNRKHKPEEKPVPTQKVEAIIPEEPKQEIKDTVVERLKMISEGKGRDFCF